MNSNCRSIAVIGAGYVGLTTALCFAELGFSVCLVENDLTRLSSLQRRTITFQEPGFQELLSKHAPSALVMTDSLEQVEMSDFVFVCVGTPSTGNGSVDLIAVHSVLQDLSQSSQSSQVWVLKSSIPPGTTEKLCSDLNLPKSRLVVNPEFLREGHCIEDFMFPSRIIIGTYENNVADALSDLYSGLQSELIYCSPTEAELIKFASNSALAIKLSFANEVSDICTAVGASPSMVLNGVGADPRIGRGMLTPGPGWGGSCLPKDTRALIHTASELGVSLSMVEAAVESNLHRAARLANVILSELRKTGESCVTIWGLTFKAQTDDLRESPALTVIDHLLAAGIHVVAFDPGLRDGESSIDRRVTIVDSQIEACQHSHLLVVLTEWEAFGRAVASEIARNTRVRVVLDTRSVLKRLAWESVGITFIDF